MKISIIMPVYNAENYLRKSLDSLIYQTYKNIEIICIDDGSKDNSLEILNEYKEKDSRIIVISQKNQGPGVARNKGIELANGEYIYFLDADDWAESNLCEKVYEIALQNNKPDIIRFKSKEFDEEKKEYITPYWFGMMYVDKRLFNTIININDIIQLHPMELPCTPWGGVIKKDFILESNIKFPDIYNSEDMIFFFKSILIAKTIYIADEFLTNYRLNNKTSISGNAVSFYDDVIKAYNIMNIYTKNLDLKYRTYFLKNIFINHIWNFYFRHINTKYEKKIYKTIKQFLKKVDLTDLCLNKDIMDLIYLIKHRPLFILKKHLNERIKNE